MLDVKIPDFLKMRPGEEPSRLYMLIKKYEEKFGQTWSTEPFDFSEKELIDTFETCLKENRTFYEVLGFNPNVIEEEEEW